MDVLTPRICQKHKMQAHQICTKYECFQEADILICSQCSSKHIDHRNDIIEISLLNEKVHDLMKKRMQFENGFQISCQALINQLKKFKVFKEQIVTSLNIRERILNDLCKKIKRNTPYEKDHQLFKHSFGYIYLTMKGINPNVDIYNKFRSQITQTISSCRNIMRKFQLNCAHTQIPTLRKKQHQISSILKKSGKLQEQPRFYTPNFNKFKKQSIKFKAPSQKPTKLLRVSSQQFFVAHGDTFSYHTASNFLFPKSFPLPSASSRISNMALIEKNAFITTQQSYIYIYDMINQCLLKQYTSSNHKSAIITDLLSIPNSTTVLNFITCPNQIVSLCYNEEKESLKVHKGRQMDAKQLEAKFLHDNFVTLFDNKVVSVYKTEGLQKQREFIFNNLMKSVDKITQNCFVVGGQCQQISMMDTRQKNTVMTMRTNQFCTHIAQIYPFSILACCGKNLKIYDLRMHKQIFNNRTDQTIKAVSVLNSECFVTSGTTLNLWSTVYD